MASDVTVQEDFMDREMDNVNMIDEKAAIDAAAAPVKGDESRFIDHLTGLKGERDGPNFNKHDGLEDHCFFAIMRHAQRADCHKGTFDNWLVEKDPPLTPEGQKQAYFAGQYLKEYFEMNNMKFDKIIIETSPFIRCVQSASNIASVLGVPEVEINFMIGEHLYARDFAEFDPIPTLNTVTAKDVNDPKLRETYLIPDSVKIVNNWRWYDKIKTRWLETLDDCHRRALIIKKNFSERLSEIAGKGELDGGKKVCYLVISHGMMVW